MNNKKVLVVEDDDISQFLIRKMLESYNIDVNVVSNGLEALENLSSNEYDVILMDIEMPVISGYETIRRLKNGDFSEQVKSTPIIGISANPFDHEEHVYLEHGMDAYISKPISPEQLEHKISSLIRSKKTS